MPYRPWGERITRGGEPRQARRVEPQYSPAHDRGKCRGTLPGGERCWNPVPKPKVVGGPQPALCEECQKRLAKDSGSLRSRQDNIY